MCLFLPLLDLILFFFFFWYCSLLCIRGCPWPHCVAEVGLTLQLLLPLSQEHLDYYIEFQLWTAIQFILYWNFTSMSLTCYNRWMKWLFLTCFICSKNIYTMTILFYAILKLWYNKFYINFSHFSMSILCIRAVVLDQGAKERLFKWPQ